MVEQDIKGLLEAWAYPIKQEAGCTLIRLPGSHSANKDYQDKPHLYSLL